MQVSKEELHGQIASIHELYRNYARIKADHNLLQRKYKSCLLSLKTARSENQSLTENFTNNYVTKQVHKGVVNEREELRVQYATLKNDYNNSVNDVQISYQSTCKELNDLRNRYKAVVEKCEELKCQNQVLENSKTDVNQLLQEENEDLIRELNECKETCAKSLKDNEQLRGAVKDYNELKNKYAALLGTTHEHTRECDRLRHKIQSLDTTVHEMRQANVEHRKKLAGLTQENENLVGRCASLKNECFNVTKQRDGFEIQVKTLERQLQQSRCEMSSFDYQKKYDKSVRNYANFLMDIRQLLGKYDKIKDDEEDYQLTSESKFSYKCIQKNECDMTACEDANALSQAIPITNLFTREERDVQVINNKYDIRELISDSQTLDQSIQDSLSDEDEDILQIIFSSTKFSVALLSPISSPIPSPLPDETRGIDLELLDIVDVCDSNNEIYELVEKDMLVGGHQSSWSSVENNLGSSITLLDTTPLPQTLTSQTSTSLNDAVKAFEVMKTPELERLICTNISHSTKNIETIGAEETIITSEIEKIENPRVDSKSLPTAPKDSKSDFYSNANTNIPNRNINESNLETIKDPDQELIANEAMSPPSPTVSPKCKFKERNCELNKSEANVNSASVDGLTSDRISSLKSEDISKPENGDSAFGSSCSSSDDEVVTINTNIEKSPQKSVLNCRVDLESKLKDIEQRAKEKTFEVKPSSCTTEDAFVANKDTLPNSSVNSEVKLDNIKSSDSNCNNKSVSKGVDNLIEAVIPKLAKKQCIVSSLADETNEFTLGFQNGDTVLAVINRSDELAEKTLSLENTVVGICPKRKLDTYVIKKECCLVCDGYNLRKRRQGTSGSSSALSEMNQEMDISKKRRIASPITVDAEVNSISVRFDNSECSEVEIASPASPEPCQEDLDYSPIIIPIRKVKGMSFAKGQQLIKEMLQFCQNNNMVFESARKFLDEPPNFIGKLILQQVSTDFHDSPTGGDYPMESRLTVVQKGLYKFVMALEKLGVDGVCGSYLREADLYLRTVDSPVLLDPVARLYVALCKGKSDYWQMRMALCSALADMGDLAIPYIYLVLQTWIEVLPRKGTTTYGHILPKAIVQLTLLKKVKTPGYNLTNLRSLLFNYYGFSSDGNDSKKLFKELLDCYMDEQNECARVLAIALSEHISVKFLAEEVFPNLLSSVSPTTTVQKLCAVITLVMHLTKHFSEKVDGANLQTNIEWLRQFSNASYPHAVEEHARQMLSWFLQCDSVPYNILEGV